MLYTDIYFDVIDEKRDFFSDFTLDVYKMASKITRDDAMIIEGTSLGTLLVPLYFAIEQYYLNADLVIMGDDMSEFARVASQVLFMVV